MTEAILNQQLNAHLKKTCAGIVIFKLNDAITSGVPDNTYTCFGRTSWVEVKYDKDGVKDRPLQNLRMKQLEVAGFAWYVIFRDRFKGEKSTWIIRPRDVDDYFNIRPLRKAEGFDFELVERYIKELHFDNTMDVFNQRKP
jgi:hypothetical protein